MVHLRPQPSRRGTETQKAQLWNEDGILALQGCSECMDWSVFHESSDNINELTDEVCSYISFCVKNVIDTKVVTWHSNNKPWINAEMKNLIKKKGLFLKVLLFKAAYSIIRKEGRAAIVQNIITKKI